MLPQTSGNSRVFTQLLDKKLSDAAPETIARKTHKLIRPMKHLVTLIPGDGIGPEVCEAVQKIIAAAGVKIEWEPTAAPAELERRGVDFMHSGVVEAIRKSRVALKGPLATPIA